MTQSLDAIRARHAAATPGPWHVGLDAGHPGNRRLHAGSHHQIAKFYAESPSDNEQCLRDIGFVNSAIDDIPALLDLVTEQAAELSQLREQVDMLRAALEPFANIADDYERAENNHMAAILRLIQVSDLRKARAALAGSAGK